MRLLLTLTLLLFLILNVFGYEWTLINHENENINNFIYDTGNYSNYAILTDNGFYLSNNTFYETNNPIFDGYFQENNLFYTEKIDEENTSLKNINLTTYDITHIENFPSIKKLTFSPFNDLGFMITDNHLNVSYNGYNWNNMEEFSSVVINDIDFNENIIAISTNDGIYFGINDNQPSFDSVENLGTLESNEIDEASGIIASRKNDGIYWIHNDSGNENKIYAVNKFGQNIGEYTLEGINLRDTEDITIGYSANQEEWFLYLADIGDNNGTYELKYIYKIPEPSIDISSAPINGSISNIQTISFQYSDGVNYDSEAMFLDPITNNLYLITKRNSGEEDRVYKISAPFSFDSEMTAEYVCSLNYPSDPIQNSGATGADITRNGTEILIKTYDAIYYWNRLEGEDLSSTFVQDYTEIEYTPELQGEAICWTADLMGYFTTSEEMYNISAKMNYYHRNYFQHIANSIHLDQLIIQEDNFWGIKTGNDSTCGIYKFNQNNENIFFYQKNYVNQLINDLNNIIFINSQEDGISYLNQNNLICINDDLEDIIVNRLVLNLTPESSRNNPIIACTSNGLYSLQDFIDIEENTSIPFLNYVYSYPNPFNPNLNIKFNLLSKSKVKIDIFNIKGERIRTICNDYIEAGTHTIIWDGMNSNNQKVASGIYFYNFNAENYHKSHKIILLK